ncbi:TPA: head-tail adaptor protein [Vibrio parahaemolyticus]|uniref:head-tail adaptor protein n=1 Tax=Vibrio harveyi group TaxID=717610 RepID=UPI000D3DC7BE|nr:head-tail adaptor protein [Vibrio parahaemolyticus]ELB1510060.1 head-tail adaptor protein [Vibrio alginolyticus]EGU0167933.1 head-tail adaptor protein [Vibrio parahaemolyticus]EHH1170562.1 head-tail adaptor protein [Vibrio parahaemolyticus]EHR0228818.1 head-tail adaptor protein [Vibrio parahaemolyticus]EJY0699851.1 head-tail adaptor protein [Vibrio parahaemolyticus]
MRAGRLKHRVELYDIVEAQDKYGAPINSRVKVGQFQADAEHEKEVVDGTLLRRNVETVVFYCRYNRQIKGRRDTMYIVFEGEEYEIQSAIDPDFMKRTMIITAKKVKVGR